MHKTITNEKEVMKPEGNHLYPRTGKRGVPQQFPRRLYNMLETEAREQSDHDRLISWSPSGNAFMIEDPVLFASLTLPKYFKTSVFSSFQRNMNLYGFVKVRKGPEAGMYYHPDFVRGKPENLHKLTKCKTATDRKISLGEAALSNASKISHPNMINPNVHPLHFSHGSQLGSVGHAPTQSTYGSTTVPIVPERSAAAAQFAARANAIAGRFQNPHEQAYIYHMHNRMPYPMYGQPYNRPPHVGGPYYPSVPIPAPGGNAATSAGPHPHPYVSHQDNHQPYPSKLPYTHNIDTAAKQNKVPCHNDKILQDFENQDELKRVTSRSRLPKHDEILNNEDSEDSSKMKGLLTLAMTCLTDGKK